MTLVACAQSLVLRPGKHRIVAWQTKCMVTKAKQAVWAGNLPQILQVQHSLIFGLRGLQLDLPLFSYVTGGGHVAQTY
jgi:hypothetical protein